MKDAKEETLKMVRSFANISTKIDILWPSRSDDHRHQFTLLTSDHSHVFSYDIHIPV